MFDDMTFDEPAAYRTTVPGAPNVWVFDTTDGAYNTTQVDDQIKDGDVLLVPSEGVAGWMCEAWPTAVTETAGAFHTLSGDGRANYAEKIAQVEAVWAGYRVAERRGTLDLEAAVANVAAIAAKLDARGVELDENDLDGLRWSIPVLMDAGHARANDARTMLDNALALAANR